MLNNSTIRAGILLASLVIVGLGIFSCYAYGQSMNNQNTIVLRGTVVAIR